MSCGHPTPLTPSELAALETIRERILTLLNGDGVTMGWIADRIGIRNPRRLATWLLALGARQKDRYWRLPNVGRLKTLDQLVPADRGGWEP